MSPASPGEGMSDTLGAVTTARSKEWLPQFSDEHHEGNIANVKKFEQHVMGSVAPWEPTPTRRQPKLRGHVDQVVNRDKGFPMKLAYDLGVGPVTVSEMYSPPRVAEAARRLRHLGIAPGFSLDLTTTDENGIP